jgi:hypothetical protein
MVFSPEALVLVAGTCFNTLATATCRENMDHESFAFASATNRNLLDRTEILFLFKRAKSARILGE